MHYVAELEIDRRAPRDNDSLDAIIEDLADYHPALSTAPTSGNICLTITVPATTLRQASTTALAVVANTHGQILTLTVLTEQLRDARQGWTPVPELVGATEAAQILKVSRQRVQQLVAAGQLPATKLGRELAIPRDAVDARAAQNR